MRLSLLSDEMEIQAEVPTEAAEALEQQLARIDSEESRRVFVEAMLKHLGRVLSGFLDPDLRPPTEKQVAYAMSLSRRFEVEIPRDALMYRDAMCDFLQKYAGNR